MPSNYQYFTRINPDGSKTVTAISAPVEDLVDEDEFVFVDLVPTNTGTLTPGTDAATNTMTPQDDPTDQDDAGFPNGERYDGDEMLGDNSHTPAAQSEEDTGAPDNAIFGGGFGYDTLVGPSGDDPLPGSTDNDTPVWDESLDALVASIIASGDAGDASVAPPIFVTPVVHNIFAFGVLNDYEIQLDLTDFPVADDGTDPDDVLDAIELGLLGGGSGFEAGNAPGSATSVIPEPAVPENQFGRPAATGESHGASLPGGLQIMDETSSYFDLA